MKMLAEGWAKFRTSLVVQVATLAVALVAGGAMVVVGVKPVSALPPSDLCTLDGTGNGQCGTACFYIICLPEHWNNPDEIPCPETEFGPC